MSDGPRTVYVVDDDAAVRSAIGMLMRSVGHRPLMFGSAAEFLDNYDPSAQGCVVLDVRMPGMSGLDVQDRLNRLGAKIPIIFVTGHGDVPMAVQAMRNGAEEFLQKPFRDQDLIDRVNQALDKCAAQAASQSEEREVLSRIEALTAREKEILHLIVTGHANKVIAADLGLSARTVEVHRANIMDKMQVQSLAELVRL
ncbi:MAG: response regulator [Gammaproteobacteria bacterium]|nr:response regulator [Gammaproteobacteria bacterium]